MMSIAKNHFPTIPTVCILFVILVISLYFVFFFNRTTIQGGSVEKLAKLMRTDFSGVEITDIQYKSSKDGILDDYTRIIMFLKETDEWESKEFYTYSEGWFDSNPEHMLPAEIAELKTIGIELHNIQKRGVKSAQIKVGFSIGEYNVYWYQIDESYDGESNIVLRVGIPRKISINVDKIIREQ